ncbi:MAG: hypothetical protein N0C90_20910, partial [Candidatus Thiodiazotropha endolucinida]|nr:hypothetical protein [Candidatus Thiodiazotropha taylori]MCW4263814.1 hypothetical protein [Candidatus Thiodiazotropha endolucinida]
IDSSDINTLVTQIENLFISNSKKTFGVKKKPHTNNRTSANKVKKKSWFNSECHRARNEYHKIRKIYNKCKTNRNKNSLKQISKDYKSKMAKNYRKHKNEKNSKLRKLRNARPKEFWKIINSIDKSKNDTAPLNDLYEFFKNLNSVEPNENSVEFQDNETFIGFGDSINDAINQAFTENEILSAVKSLRNNKSHGIDNILNEYIKSTIQIMCPIYTKLFNIILDTGIVPDSWSVETYYQFTKTKGVSTLLNITGRLPYSVVSAKCLQQF